MSLLSYNELCELVERGVITNVEPTQINSTSIDLTLGENIMVESLHPDSQTGIGLHGEYIRTGLITLRDRVPPFYSAKNIKDKSFTLKPGQFILAQTEQVFNLPEDISAEYKLKSSMARIGLEHLNAGWCDAGWNGSVLTLELKNMLNYHSIELHHGVSIGQVVFFRHTPVPYERSYAARGRYNQDKTVKAIKE